MSTSHHHSGHRERLRNRFLNNGNESLYNHELLEMLLFYPIPRLNTNNLAHALIDRFGTISKVLEAEESELRKVKGMGASSAAFIRFIGDISSHFREFSAEQAVLATTDEIIAYVNKLFFNKEQELCTIIILDSEMSVKNLISFPFGNILDGHIDIREITRQVLLTNTRNIVVSLNHPLRRPIPDANDFAIINSIAKTLTPISIRLIDSTVSGKGMTVSMRSQGAFGFI